MAHRSIFTVISATLTLPDKPHRPPRRQLTTQLTLNHEGISHQLTIPDGPQCVVDLFFMRPYASAEFLLSFAPAPDPPNHVELRLYTKNHSTQLLNCPRPLFQEGVLHLAHQLFTHLSDISAHDAISPLDELFDQNPEN